MADTNIVAFDVAFRDYATDGVPSSGANEPDKSQVRGSLESGYIYLRDRSVYRLATFGTDTATLYSRSALPAGEVLASGMLFVFVPGVDCGDNPQIKIGSVTLPTKWPNGTTNLTATDLLAGYRYFFIYETPAKLILLSLPGTLYTAISRLTGGGDSVTNGQMRRALSDLNKLDEFIDGLPADPNDAAKIQWDAAEPTKLGDALCTKIAAVLGYGSPGMLTLFNLAKTM